jgi:sugar O-acyltransferase (sialic acid O-acetyltransferase NeuD family)
MKGLEMKKETRDKILIFGSSGHTGVVIDIVEKESKFDILGLVDPHRDPNEEFMGYQVIGKEEELEGIVLRHDVKGGIIAIGDNWLRKTVRDKILKNCPDFQFLSCIHPCTQIGKNVTIGRGTVVMPGVSINSGCVVHEHCILNTNSSLDHDSVMGEFSSLAPGATLGGDVGVGNFSVISMGANVIHGKKIGEHSLIGAGALINDNVGDRSVWYGVPAKFIRSRQPGERYL